MLKNSFEKEDVVFRLAEMNLLHLFGIWKIRMKKNCTDYCRMKHELEAVMGGEEIL